MRQTRRIVFLLLWHLLVGVTPLLAGVIGEEAMVSLTLADGLAGETVHCVMTDHNGGTWLGTSSGINIYNGRQLTTLPLTNEKGRTLEVLCLAEVNSQCVYAATDDGLYRIQYGNSRAERVLPEVKSAISLLAVGDTLFIGSEQGLLMYDGRQLHHQDVDVSRKGLANIVRQYAKGDDGLIWFLGRYDLNSYDPRTGHIERYPLNLPSQETIVSQFACLGNRRFVVGTRGKGLYLCDIQRATAECIAGVGNIVMSVQRSLDGKVCVATDGLGAYLLEERDGRLEVTEHFHTGGDTHHRLPSNGTYCYYRDANKVNWFGFVRYGLAHSFHQGDLFQPLRIGNLLLENMNIRTYCRHGDDVVIGTQEGCFYLNVKTQQHRYFSPDELSGGHIVNTICWYDGKFFVGTFDGGISILDPQTLSLKRQAISPLLDGVSVGDLKAGPDGRLWIGCSRGLFIVKDMQVDQHFTERNSPIVSGLILSITFDKSGNAWLTGAKGCSLYSVRSHAIEKTDFPPDFFNHEAWMRGAQGHDGFVFLRTGPKTYYTNEGMTDYGELLLPVAMKDKWCRAFVDDMLEFYLVASERGLYSFEYQRDCTTLKAGGVMMHYGDGEGLHGDFINHMSIDSLGILWVATSQGLYYTDHQRLTRWKASKQYQVQLINIRRGSDLLEKIEEYAVNDQHTLSISWNFTSQVIQTELMLPDYARHYGRIYEYRLGGGDWLLVEDGQSLRLSGLELGNNRLEVRQAGMPGTAAVYTITVVPSFWAVFELVLLVLSVVALWLWWRFRKTAKVLLSERDEIEDALVEAMEQIEVPSGAVGGAKYDKVKIDEEECAAIVQRMKEYLDRERVYTNADLKMKDLADVLHLSAPKLSQVFNLYLGQNYYDFINGYRLNEFTSEVLRKLGYAN